MSFRCRAVVPAFAALAIVSAFEGTALAQRPVQQVLELNRGAMEAYNNLDIEAANEQLHRAEEIARRGNVSGAALARTYLNLGVVAVGGLQDNATGLDYFERALRTDPTVQLDPLTSTPEIQTVFSLARSHVGSSSGSADAGVRPDSGGGRPPPDAGVEPAGEGVPNDGDMQHDPVVESPPNTPIPLYAEVRERDARVVAFFRALGQSRYEPLEMNPRGDGYAAEIPCTSVLEPTMTYFVVAYDNTDRVVGAAGSESRPVHVQITRQLRGPAPRWPGSRPPLACEDERPRGDLGLGDSCEQNYQCGSGLECDRGFCALADETGPGHCPEGTQRCGDECCPSSGGSSSSWPRFFGEVSASFAFPWVDNGMTADSDRPSSEPAPTMPPPHESAWENCVGDIGVPNATHCTVRITAPGFVATFALRIALGYYVWERLGVALTFRFQPDSGAGDFASMLLGVRLQYLVTEPAPTGLVVAPFLGGGGGQIQPHPPQSPGPGPYVISGYGNINAGAVIGYRFTPNVGIVFTPQIDFMVPLFLFSMDASAGLHIAF